MITRIVRLKGYRNILMGRDLANLLTDGHVYQLHNVEGVIIMMDLGEHADGSMLRECATLGAIGAQGTYCLTKPEYLTSLEKSHEEFESTSMHDEIQKLKKELGRK